MNTIKPISKIVVIVVITAIIGVTATFAARQHANTSPEATAQAWASGVAQAAEICRTNHNATAVTVAVEGEEISFGCKR